MTIDISKEGVIMKRYDFLYDYADSCMVECVDGEYVRHEDTQVEITRLTAERDGLQARLRNTQDAWSKQKDRAEKAEAERDAIAAAAFEAAAMMPKSELVDDDNWGGRIRRLSVEDINQRIRALTPSDAKSELDRQLRRAKVYGLREAADLVPDYEQDGTAEVILVRANEVYWGDPVGNEFGVTPTQPVVNSLVVLTALTPEQRAENRDAAFVVRGWITHTKPVAQEPVAWQWRARFKDGGAWDAWEMGRYLRPVPPFMDFEERPLYAHPATPAPVEAGLLDGLLATWAGLTESAEADLAEDIAEAETTGERPDLWAYKLEVGLDDARDLIGFLTALRVHSAPVGGEGVK